VFELRHQTNRHGHAPGQSSQHARGVRLRTRRRSKPGQRR
jgi:hypothetical protein